jgi:uncharacterized membrane protein
VIGFVLRVPMPIATGGFFTLADAVILFAAFTLGPVSAAISGALGAALIDLLSGYVQFAPTSFVVHGLEGLLAGLIAMAAGRERPSVVLWVLAGIAGTAVVVGGYLASESLFYVTFEAALTEVPTNLVQGAVGAAVGALLAVAVRRAYPPIARLRW